LVRQPKTAVFFCENRQNHPDVKVLIHIFAEVCNTIACQLIELERCSNLLQIRNVFYFRLRIIFFVLGLVFSVGDIIMGSCFCLFGHIYLALGANPTSYFWLKFFLESTLSST